MRHAKHLLIALGVIVVAGAGGFGVLRSMIPDDFGNRGGSYFRASSLDEQKELPMRDAQERSCLRPACHGKEAPEKQRTELSGGHKEINCQACHGPAFYHVASDGKEQPPKPSEEISLCLNCHLAVTGRPKSVKQIDDFESHLEDMGGEDEKSCVDCHDSHTCEVVD